MKFVNRTLVNKAIKSNVLKMSPKKPARMWIDGKCFDIKQYKKKTHSKKEVNSEEASSETITVATEMSNFNISTNEHGKMFTSFRLPSMYYIRLHNFPDFTLKNLETETSTEIIVPKHGVEGNIIINGHKVEDIMNARNEIHSVINEIRDRNLALQFISIPVHSDEVKESFEKFKSEIISGDPIKGVDETIFQSSLKLHLTIVVFALMDETEKNEAINALNDYKMTVLDPLIAKTGPLKIEISGIECMNENISKVDVLYAKARIINETDENILQAVANGISDFFYERGLVRKYQDSVKLHVTLINTKYRKVSNEHSPNKKKRWVKRQPFDARPIMEKYKDYHFGTCGFDSIHLSLISSKGEDGFYKPMSVISVNA